jgi:LysR family transcriptional regulator, benzoate and cis,cis-muconate-responsive activator of ben and cat genes
MRRPKPGYESRSTLTPHILDAAIEVFLRHGRRRRRGSSERVDTDGAAEAAPRLHDDIIAAVRAHGVVLNLAPEILDREALWTLVASGLGLTFAGERGARFLDLGGAIGGAEPLQLGSAVWRPLRNLGVELRDVAMWRADAERSPLLRPLIDIVDELRTQFQSLGPSRKGRERAR